MNLSRVKKQQDVLSKDAPEWFEIAGLKGVEYSLEPQRIRTFKIDFKP
jgi:hypothetical protein